MAPRDLNRTIEFILQSQARAELRQERADARQAKLDRRVDSLTKIVTQGMRILTRVEATTADIGERQRKMDQALTELAAGHKQTQVALADLARAQAATERSLRALIADRRNGRNGL